MNLTNDCWKVAIAEVEKDVDLNDLVEIFPMSTYLVKYVGFEKAENDPPESLDHTPQIKLQLERGVVTRRWHGG